MPRIAVNGVLIGMSIPCCLDRHPRPIYHSLKMNMRELIHLKNETMVGPWN